jgi:hypothetical protein
LISGGNKPKSIATPLHSSLVLFVDADVIVVVMVAEKLPLPSALPVAIMRGSLGNPSKGPVKSL